MLDDRYRLAYRLYPYERSPDQDCRAAVRHPVVVVGGGPDRHGAALDLGLGGIAGAGAGRPRGRRPGQPRDLLRQAHAGDLRPAGLRGADGGQGRGLEPRQGLPRRPQVFEFNLLPEDGHRSPAFINLPQPYFEKFLVDRIRERAGRRRADRDPRPNRVTALSRRRGRSRHAGRRRPPTGPTRSRPTGCSPATAPARPSARCWASASRGASSRTAS